MGSPKQEVCMFARKTQDQGTIGFSQMDYLPILIESFLIDRKAQGLSIETVRIYKKKLKYFAKFCESQAVTQVSQLTPDLLRHLMTILIYRYCGLILLKLIKRFKQPA
jgi:hypothetical protein